MRKLIMILIVCVPIFATAQTPKKDTVYQQVPVYQHTDTVKIKAALIPAGNGNNMVIFIAPAYILQTGFAVQVEDPTDKTKKRLQWTQEPKVSGVLTSKKERIKEWLLLIQ